VLPLQKQRDAWIGLLLVQCQRSHRRNNPAGLLLPNQQALSDIKKEKKKREAKSHRK